MLKLNASYSKKVPAEGEYTSQSYHASIEVELPDGLSQEQLNGKIHETFALVKESVEAELSEKMPARQGGNAPQNTVEPNPQGYDSVLKVKPFFELFLKIIPDCMSDQPLSWLLK